MKFTKYRKALLLIFILLELFIAIVFSSFIHEMVHFAQDGFRGDEICFSGLSPIWNLNENTAAGWYVPFEGNKPFIPGFNFELEAYGISFIISLVLMVFICFKYRMIDNRLKKYDELIIEYNKWQKSNS